MSRRPVGEGPVDQAKKEGPLSIEEVLAEEAEAIHGNGWHTDRSLSAHAAGQGAQKRRVQMNADERSGKEIDDSEIERRKKLYCALNAQYNTALCLSGGGIRSATFCLGVIQALAGYDVLNAPEPAKPREKDKSGAPASPVPAAADSKSKTSDKTKTTADAAPTRKAVDPANSLLGRLNYLSTVSGGGYIGSWLSAWRQRDNFPTIVRNLTGRPSGPDVEPPEISWLRAYSNYLTPKTGLLSADTWSGVAIYLRNLLLNWLIIIPAIAIALLGLKVVATSAVWIARDGSYILLGFLGLAGAACLILALAFTTAHRPTRREYPGSNTTEEQGNVYQGAFIWGDLVWTLASAFLITSVLTSRCGAEWVVNNGKWGTLLQAALAGLAIYVIGWLVGKPLRSSCRDFIRWAGSGLIYGALVGVGAYLFTLLQPYGMPGSQTDRHELFTLLIPMIFGVPWVLTSQLVAEMIFVGLTSYQRRSDSDREWFGRAAGWVAIGAIGWTVVALLTLVGALLLTDPELLFGLEPNAITGHLHKWIASAIASVGGVSGIITALLGGGGSTSVKPGANQGGKAISFDVIIKIAGPVFAAALTIILSYLLDEALIGGSLVDALRIKFPDIATIFGGLVLGLALAVLIEWVASINVNINRFSLHAVYRNRLIRGYLGATRQERHPDNFTGFDDKDNVDVHELWPAKEDAQEKKRTYGLFHVVNIALNVVSGKRLAWQERKAESFTVSALHSGAAYKGFRPSNEYGDKPGGNGISLGTAMAISGAAASPNMGYHSSPSITLLLALFNVRLGWWLGNPGPEGAKTYQSDGPNYAIKPLFQETFGLTTDTASYVYLSDGGHFENLGLYEMVRRRCRFVVAVDAGCDPDFAFEDLGNAVRKIYIDLGIRIEMIGLDLLRNRPEDKHNDANDSIPYHAIGRIHYAAADGADCADGWLLYIKPAVHFSSTTEGAGVRSYAEAHKPFPHESTGDQWFTESQFESYRSLGLDVTNAVLGKYVELAPASVDAHGNEVKPFTLHALLKGLNATTR